MLNRKTETKYIGQWLTTNVAQTGFSPFPPPRWQNVVQTLGLGSGGNQYWNIALPAMIQGTTDITRIGDRLEPQSLSVKLNLRFTDKAAQGVVAQDTPLDITAYIFYGTIKSLKTYAGATSFSDARMVASASSEALTAMNNLLDFGDLTFRTFDGSQEFAQLPLSSYTRMKVKKVHLRRAAGWINTPAGLTDPTPNTDSQNTLRKEVTLKWKVPSKLEYTNSSDIYPNNFAPVFAIGYVYNDATASTNQNAPAYGDGQIEYTALSSLYFKDHQ